MRCSLHQRGNRAGRFLRWLLGLQTTNYPRSKRLSVAVDVLNSLKRVWLYDIASYQSWRFQMHKGIAQLAEFYPNCFRQPRKPLKIGIHNDIIARHPELRPGVLTSALKTYTRSLGYLETLKAGAARIDLEGDPVGTVTAADEEDAKRKIAKAARRAAAKAIEDCKAAGQPAAKPVAKCAGQQDPILEAKSARAEPPLGLAGLKAAAQARRARLVAAK
jgi:sRNA-binding protein